MKHLLLTLPLLAPVAAWAEEFEVAPPVIPGRTVSVADHGAKPDDAAASTAAIQKAIDAARDAGGGRVLVPAGRYLSGPLELRSGIDLHLGEGAVLVMSDTESDFSAERGYRPGFITVRKAHDVRISGKGRIEGQGGRWWREFLELKARGADKAAPRRPQLIGFEDCERVEVSGITTNDPPNTHYSFKRCTDLTVRGIRATAPDESPNTDALNISCAWNVLIEDSFISTGDDNIVLLCGSRAKDGGPGVENVRIRNCELGFGHGLSIGSYTSGGVRNVEVENVSFDRTTSGLRLKAGRDRGGPVEHLRFSNIRMKRVRYPVFFCSYYPKPPAHPSADIPHRGEVRMPVWRDIIIDGLEVTESRNSMIIWGLPDEPVRDVLFRNSRIAAEAGGLLFHARDIDLSGLTIEPEAGPELRTFSALSEGMAGEKAGEGNIKFK